jgi:hypothetical protein
VSKNRGWCGMRARDGWEWHHRKAISEAYWRISDARQAQNDWAWDMDINGTYDAACREVRAKQPKLHSGHAVVFSGGKCVHHTGAAP